MTSRRWTTQYVERLELQRVIPLFVLQGTETRDSTVSLMTVGSSDTSERHDDLASVSASSAASSVFDLDRSDRKISAHATLQTPPRPESTVPPAAKGRASPVRASAPAPPARTPSPKPGSEQEVKRRNKGKAPAPPPTGRPSSLVERADSATPPPDSRPKSAHVANSAVESPRHGKRRISSPHRALRPVPSEERSPDKALLDEERSPSPASQRLSPEKDLALRTLDDVIQEAEETMGSSENVSEDGGERSIVQALNTHINEEDQYEDVRIISRTGSGASSGVAVRVDKSASVSSASPQPTPPPASPGISMKRADGSEVIIPPEAREDVVIISSEDTTMVATEKSGDDISQDTTHVSVVVVGEDDVKVLDSSSSLAGSASNAPSEAGTGGFGGANGGIVSNGPGDLSDLSRSFSSASHASSAASSSKDSNGARNRQTAATNAQHERQSPRQLPLPTPSPNSIILEGSTVTATDTDDMPAVSPSPKVSPSSRHARNNGHVDRQQRTPSPAKSLRQSAQPQSSTPIASSEDRVMRKTRRAISEQVMDSNGRPRHHRESPDVDDDEEDEGVELRRSKWSPRTEAANTEEKRDAHPTAPVLRRKEDQQAQVGAAVSRKTPLTKEDIAKMNLKRKTRKRTRKFEIDGVVVTTTTSKVIYGDEENERFYDDHYFRKQELRELKLLQKQEQKQFQDLAFKNQACREQQEKRFDQERAILVRNYENDLQSMAEQQRKQVDKAEEQQHVDLKITSKRIRGEQEKELKSFRESLKQEGKLLKQEVELRVPKERRKEELKARKDQLERDHQLRVSEVV